MPGRVQGRGESVSDSRSDIGVICRRAKRRLE